MYFNGTNSKFEEGDTVVLHLKEQEPIPVKIISVGVLGNKLSGHVFLYHVEDATGKKHDVIEKALFPPE